MKKSVFFLLTLFLCGFSVEGSKAEVSLPGFFSDHMVIQRERPVRIWGRADRNEPVEVNFNGERKTTRADRRGRWEVIFEPMTHGGPYTLSVTGRDNSVVLSDILVGDVWLCSGQSNMEWTVSMADNAAAEIAAAEYPEIRSLNIPNIIHRLPQDDLDARWVECSPETAGDFSAVAYYYARELYRALGIPIGIINASWGGTAIEAWTSPESYCSLPEMVRMDFDDGLITGLDRYLAKNHGDMDGYMQQRMGDTGMREKWYSDDTDVSSWERMVLPRDWGATSLEATDGMVWFRRNFDIPDTAAGLPATMHLGRIDDNDITWVNGTEVGRTNGHSTTRIYEVADGVLKPGRNTVTVRVTDELAMGGFMSLPDDMYLETADGNSPPIPLSGEWSYCPTVVNEDFYRTYIGPNTIYSLAYNAMINPLTNFPIKGVIWYQGENNVPQPYPYRTLFPNLIHDWRGQWGEEFPFYWVQLPNFMEKDEQPSESQWAELREAQAMALSVSGTGQAVTIDIGEGDNLHPGNKQDVGNRLALLALDKTYGMEVVSSGPTYRSMEKKGGAVIIEFDLHGSEWQVRNRYGYIEGFAIAGEDRRFVWAKALLKGNRIVVWSEQVPDPVAVRYGWGNNPEVNLFNTEGLPAAPFRTDSWGVTE